jgi:hypothetical protein
MRTAAVITAGATPSIGIDRWWATVGDDPIEVNLYISVPEKAEYISRGDKATKRLAG